MTAVARTPYCPLPNIYRKRSEMAKLPISNSYYLLDSPLLLLSSLFLQPRSEFRREFVRDDVTIFDGTLVPCLPTTGRKRGPFSKLYGNTPFSVGRSCARVRRRMAAPEDISRDFGNFSLVSFMGRRLEERYDILDVKPTNLVETVVSGFFLVGGRARGRRIRLVPERRKSETRSGGRTPHGSLSLTRNQLSAAGRRGHVPFSPGNKTASPAYIRRRFFAIYTPETNDTPGPAAGTRPPAILRNIRKRRNL